MKYAEAISAFENKRAAIVAVNDSIMEKAAADGATLADDDKETFDGNAADVAEIDGHLARLRSSEKAMAALAVPVDDDATGRPRGSGIVVKTSPKLAPGIEFARLARCFALGSGIPAVGADIARKMYGEESRTFGVLKANVSAGATLAGSWAENLVGDESSAFADFVEYLRPQTIVGRFGQGGIPPLRSVPFRVALIGQSAKGDGYWVGEGAAKPLTNMGFTRTTLTPLKVANIAVLTEEVLRDSSPSAETLVRDELAAALRARIDIDFVDPANAGVANIKPESITHDAVDIVSAGDDAEAVRTDIRSLLQLYVNANNPASTAVLIMRAGDAMALSLMTNPLGQAEFSGIGVNGGSLLGIPTITSEYVPAGIVIVVNASDVYLADEGGIEVSLSREASLEMSTVPTGNSVTVTAAALVSMFQTNSVAFRAERCLNWAPRRPEAVAYLTGVSWGGPVTAPLVARGGRSRSAKSEESEAA